MQGAHSLIRFGIDYWLYVGRWKCDRGEAAIQVHRLTFIRSQINIAFHLLVLDLVSIDIALVSIDIALVQIDIAFHLLVLDLVSIDFAFHPLVLQSEVPNLLVILIHTAFHGILVAAVSADEETQMTGEDRQRV